MNQLVNDASARMIERIFFPSNTIIAGGILLLIYLRNEAIILNDVLAFTVAILVFGVLLGLLDKAAIDKNKRYFAGALSAILAFFVCYSLFELSREMVEGGFCLLTISLFVYAVRPKWKVSVHMTVLVTVSAALSLLDWVFIPLILPTPLVIWAKLRMKAHTVAQLIVGGIVGLLVPLVIHSLFTNMVWITLADGLMRQP